MRWGCSATGTRDCAVPARQQTMCAKARPGRARRGPAAAAAGPTEALWAALGAAARGRAAEAGRRAGRAAGLEPLPPGFPPGPAGDQALRLARDPLAFVAALAAEHGGGAVGFAAAGERVVLVSDPGLAREVLADSSVWVKKGTAFFPGSGLTGEGLLTSDGAVWRRQRRLASPAFRRAALEAYGAQMAASTERMLSSEKWVRGGEIDAYRDFNDLTLEIVAGALFGASVPAAQAAAVNGSIAATMEFFTRSASQALVPGWLPTPENLQFARAVKELDRVVYGLIAERRRDLAGGPDDAEHGDLLSAMVAATDEDGARMDDRALRDELMTMMVAGQETSAILLAWTVALLAKHPEVQEVARAEVLGVLAQGGSPDMTSSAAFPFVEACILEALRLYPPAFLVGRCAHGASTTLGGAGGRTFRLPKGTTALVSPWLLHRSAALWDDPETFDPKRWDFLLEESGGNLTRIAHHALKDFGPNGAFIPFGAGPRNCIGTGFALVEAVLVTAALLSRCRLSFPGGDPARGFPRPDALLTLRPASFTVAVAPVRATEAEAEAAAAAGDQQQGPRPSPGRGAGGERESIVAAAR